MLHFTPEIDNYCIILFLTKFLKQISILIKQTYIEWDFFFKQLVEHHG